MYRFKFCNSHKKGENWNKRSLAMQKTETITVTCYSNKADIGSKNSRKYEPEFASKDC